MLSIRLSRTGKKKQPHYRIIVVEKSRDPWGKSLEILGSRNPRTKETVLKAERIKHWLEMGAQPSNSVWNILIEEKLVEGKKKGVTHISKKRTAKAAEAEAEAKAKKEEAAEEPKEKAPAEEEAAPEETTKEEPKEESKEETPAEEKPAE